MPPFAPGLRPPEPPASGVAEADAVLELPEAIPEEEVPEGLREEDPDSKVRELDAEPEGMTEVTNVLGVTSGVGVGIAVVRGTTGVTIVGVGATAVVGA